MRFGIVIPLLLMVVPARAQQSAEKRQPAQDDAAINGKDAVHTPATQDPSYVIGAEDVLDINVWKEAELTRTVPVRPDGKISLPLLNDVQAAGLTPTQLASEITRNLKKFVTNPQVTVIVSQINSQRVYILGEAVRPGAYPLLPGMNVLQALSSAGGFTMFANTKNIYVLRREGGKQEKFPFNYKDVINGKHADQNIVLRAGDQIIVP
ncbi:MAG TPA: polysaccharide biosynthesis/export family protein [Candidatus Polarisedimenticolia bacterium]|nr:polysaccharide biosynthesis/export family protein [Candidatus Polarisedimenticolia bacterium]